MDRAIPVSAFNDNYIWLIHIMDEPGSTHVAIVDPGDAAPVLETLKKLSLSPDAILITHHHYDHVGGVRKILQHYSIPVYGPASENIPALDFPLKNNDTVSLNKGAFELRVIEVPGHTSGHIAFYTPGMLLCGDTIFAGGCGRLFEGTPKQMYHSLEASAHYRMTLKYIAPMNIRWQTSILHCVSNLIMKNCKSALQQPGGYAPTTSRPCHPPWQWKNRRIPFCAATSPALSRRQNAMPVSPLEAT